MNRVEFLQKVEPFNLLPQSVLEEVAGLMKSFEFEKETNVYYQDKTELLSIDIIVEGQYDAFFYDQNQEKKLEKHYTAGFVYGGGSILLNKRKSIRSVVAHKGTKILTLNRDDFKSVCRSYEKFFQYFTHQFGQKMLNDEYAQFIKRNTSIEGNFIDADQIFTRTIDTITPRQLILCSPNDSAESIAKIMVEKTVNCVYIVEEKRIIGIITKDMLVKRVMSKGKSNKIKAISFLKKNYIAIQHDALVYDALLKMFQAKLEFILVRRGTENLGYISRYRLLTEHAQSPLVFIQGVKLAQTVDELKEKWARVPELITRLIGRGVNAEIVNQIVTTIADTILLQVIHGVKNEMPPAPAKFAFMVMGSEGRQEQTLVTDQDNAIIYEDKANEKREEVRKYFLEFAKMISERLDYVGFKFCEGGFMAMNPKWTHSLSHWKRTYDQWINEASPDNVIKFSTFFDCRLIYGNKHLFQELDQYMINCIDKTSSQFLYHLVSNALHYEPPLTFFNNIRTISKDDKKVFNIKHAMNPIVDIIRMNALKNKIIEPNTGRRMQRLFEEGHYSEKQYKEIRHAYYYLMGMRLKNQSVSIIEDFEPPTNFVPIDSLTQVEYSTLKEIFKFIKNLQSGIKMTSNIG